MVTPNSSRTDREEMRSNSCWMEGGGGEAKRPRQLLLGRDGGRGGEGGREGGREET